MAQERKEEKLTEGEAAEKVAKDPVLAKAIEDIVKLSRDVEALKAKVVEARRPTGKGVVEGGDEEHAARRKTILEKLKSVLRANVKEQWMSPVGLAYKPGAYIRGFIMTTEMITGAPGDVVNIPYVKDFDMDVLASVGASLTEKTGLIGTVQTTLREAAAHTTIGYADVEKMGEDVVGALEEKFSQGALRAEDKIVLDDIIADAGVPEIDKSAAAERFASDWVVEALSRLLREGKSVTPDAVCLVIDPQMYEALFKSIAASTGLVFARPDVVQKGIIAQWLGVNILVSHYLPEWDTVAHKRSAFMIHRNAYCLAPKRELLVETERDTVARKIKITGSHTIGGRLIDNKAVVEIKTPVVTP